MPNSQLHRFELNFKASFHLFVIFLTKAFGISILLQLFYYFWIDDLLICHNKSNYYL